MTESEPKKKFQKIANAYEVLSNPEKRQTYDQFGEEGLNQGGGGGGPNMNFDDIFSQMFGGGGGPFGGMGGGQQFHFDFGGGGDPFGGHHGGHHHHREPEPEPDIF